LGESAVKPQSINQSLNSALLVSIICLWYLMVKAFLWKYTHFLQDVKDAIQNCGMSQSTNQENVSSTSSCVALCSVAQCDSRVLLPG